MNTIYLDLFRKTIRLGNRFRRISEINLAREGYVWNQFDVLRHIRPGESPITSEIAKKTVRQNSNLTPILNHFEKLGYIQRTNDKNDRRIVRVSLTAAGEKERERLLLSQRSFISEVFKGIKEEDIQKILKEYEKINKYIEESFPDCFSSERRHHGKE